MKRFHPWIGVVLLIAFAIGAFLLVFPIVAPTEDRVQRGPGDPEVQVVVDNPRLLLPHKAGEPAVMFFDLTNRSDGGLYLIRVGIEHGGGTSLMDLQRPTAETIDAIYVPPGETFRLSPETGHAILTDYDSSVVPGALATAFLKFENGEVFRMPVEVGSMIEEGREVALP